MCLPLSSGIPPLHAARSATFQANFGSSFYIGFPVCHLCLRSRELGSPTRLLPKGILCRWRACVSAKVRAAFRADWFRNRSPVSHLLPSYFVCRYNDVLPLSSKAQCPMSSSMSCYVKPGVSAGCFPQALRSTGLSRHA